MRLGQDSFSFHSQNMTVAAKAHVPSVLILISRVARTLMQSVNVT